MPALGEMLVADGVCSQQQIEDAIQNQVILGGRMGTNLVELGVIDEETLARYLSRQHELPSVSGENVQPDPQALAMIGPEVANSLEIIPFIKESKRLQVLCVDPRNIKILDEVAFITGLTPDPIVVAEIRFWELLERCYHIKRGLRYVALDAQDFMAKTLMERKPAAGVEPSVSEDLLSEDAFAKLYQRRDGFPNVKTNETTSSLSSADNRQHQLLPSEAMPLLTAADLEELEEEPPSGPPGNIERRVWQRDSAVQDRRSEDRALSEAASAAPSFPPPAEEEEDSPLTFEEASLLLASVSARNDIAHLVLRYARSLFTRAMLFTVHRGVALGWDAVGDRVDRWSFRSVMIPLDSPSVFQLVVDNRAHYLGGLTKTRVNIEFLKVMGKQVPLSAFLLPILVRGRVVNILYGDNGHKAHCPSSIGDLLILAQRIGRCYETLFEKKRMDYLSKTGP